MSPAAIKLCADAAYVSCKVATINADLLGKSCFLLPGKVEVKLLDGNDNAYNYAANGTTFFGAYNPTSGALNGNAHFANGSVFTLDFVEGKEHVWRQVDLETGKEEPIGYGNHKPSGYGEISPTGYAQPTTNSYT